jgi:Tfp pilus assembly protein PilN
MIRINLLGIARPTARPAAAPPTAARQALIFLASVLAAFAIVGFIWRYWTTEINRLNQEYAKQQIEAERLKQIRAENQRYVQQRQQLESRIDTIQTLVNSRVGPADFMTALGNVVNRSSDLYLLTVTPEGARVVIQGQSNSVDSIASFVANLENSGSFEQVQLRQYFQDDQPNRMSFKFHLDCVYRLPSAAPAAVQPAAAAPGRQAGM